MRLINDKKVRVRYQHIITNNFVEVRRKFLRNITFVATKAILVLKNVVKRKFRQSFACYKSICKLSVTVCSVGVRLPIVRTLSRCNTPIRDQSHVNAGLLFGKSRFISLKGLYC